MGTLIVTGGAGFIGSNFVRHALAMTEDRLVVVVDKLTYAGNLESLAEIRDQPRFSFVEADIADREAMRALFAAEAPDRIVNFAAESHVDRSIDDPGSFVRSNITGTFELLECSRHYLGALPSGRADAFRFLHISTDEVYGSLGETGLFTEQTPYAPSSPYSASKAAADHLVQAYHETYGLPTLLTNCSNNYGPFQFPEKLIPLMILNAIDGKPLPIYGDGRNVCDWLYVEDHCAGLLTVLERGAAGRKYNLGGDCERTNLQVVDGICEALEHELPAAENASLRDRGITAYGDLKTFVEDRPGHDRRYAIDASRVRGELGWRPDHSFDSGLARTVRWYIDNETWCRSVQSGSYRRQRLGLGEPTEDGT